MPCLRVIVCTLALAAFSAAQTSRPPAWANDPQVEARIDALLKQMTLDEKVGQLITDSAGAPTGPGTGRSDYKEMVAKGQLGSIFNVTTADETNALQKIALEK